MLVIRWSRYRNNVPKLLAEYGNINLRKFEPVYGIVSETEILIKNGSQFCTFLSLSNFAAFIGKIFPKILLE